ncbi:MAG: hypothetical protein R3A50_01835 [Saprospiraceae bacterium]
METVYKNENLRLWQVLIGLVLLTKVVLMAFWFSVTHDEVSTIMVHPNRTFWDIITYETNSIPNNHILNTLCIRVMTYTFGVTVFFSRLPNMLGFLLGFYFGIRLLRLLSASQWYAVLLGIALLFVNCYYLEFCALARGYAMSVNLVIVSLYYAYEYTSREKLSALIWSLFWAILSVWANFTALHYYLTLLVFYFVVIVFHDKGVKRKIWDLSVMGISMVIIAFECYLPITRMRAHDEFRFYGSKGFYDDTLITLLKGSFNGTNYGSDFPTVVVIIYLLLTTICITSSYFLIRKYVKNLKHPLVFTTFMLVFTALSTISQFHLLGVNYLTGRTALIFIPLFAFMLSSALSYFVLRNKKIEAVSIFVAIVLITYWSVHFVRSIHVKSTYDWWYEKNTLEMIACLKQEYQDQKRCEPMSLGTNWLFQPALSFYIENGNCDLWIAPVPYQKELSNDGRYEYVYIEANQLDDFKDKYSEIKRFDMGILMKRK